MAHETLKATIRQYIGPNGQNSITGQIMQDILIAMVDEYPDISGYATQSWVQQQGYITSSALSGYATQSWVQQQGYVTSSALDDYLPLSGGTLTGDLYLTNGKKINIILIEGRRIVDLNLGYSQISGTEYAWNMYIESALDVSAGLDMDGVFVGSGFKKIDGTSSQFLKADGSVDGNSYLLSSGGTITGNLTVGGILIASSGNLHIFGASGGGNAVVFEVQNSLDVMFNGGFEYFFDAQITAPAFNNTSDLRKKTIMGDVPMNIYNVANAPLFKFTWKDEKKYSGQHIGSAAQYWQTVLPELVSIGRDADMTLAMQYDVIALASAITVAKTVVDHEARIRQLEEKIK